MKKSIQIIIVTLLMLGCSYEVAETPEEEVTEVAAVQMQVVASLIEGVTVCFDKNNTCKNTDTNGMVEFDSFGIYSFKIRDMNLSKVKIDSNRTIISPYVLFDENETLAKRAILVFHAFDKTEKLDDEEVLLTLSTYIPDDKSIELLLAKTELELTYVDENNTDVNSTEENITKVLVSEYEILEYVSNDINISNSKEHNITINFTENNITRDDNDVVHIDVPIKESYESLNDVMNFVELAVDKNVTIGNLEEKYLLTKNSLTGFNLGDKYVVTSIVKIDHVVISFFDNASRTTDESILIVTDEDNVLSTNLLNLHFDESENENEIN